MSSKFTLIVIIYTLSISFSISYAEKHCITGYVDLCISNNKYEEIIRNIDIDFDKKSQFITKQNINGSIKSIALTKYVNSIYKDIERKYSNSLYNDRYNNVLKIRPLGEIIFQDDYLNDGKMKISILIDSFKNICYQMSKEDLILATGIKKNDIHYLRENCLSMIKDMTDDEYFKNMNGKIIKDTDTESAIIPIINYSAVIYIIKISRMIRNYRNNFLSKGTVYFSESIDTPLVNPTGDIYIPKKILSDCNKKCIEVILLHEVLHSVERLSSNFFKNLPNTILQRAYAMDKNLKNLFDKNKDKEELIKKLSQMDKVSKIFPRESYIDLAALDYLKDDSHGREVYLNLFNSSFIEGANKYRIYLMKIINNYLDEYNKNNLLIAILSYYSWLGKIELLGIAHESESTTNNQNDDSIFRSVFETNIKNIMKLIPTEEEKRMFRQYIKVSNKYLMIDNPELIGTLNRINRAFSKYE